MDDSARPIAHLRDLMRDYPELPRLVDQFRAGKGRELPDWPDWCLLPMAAWAAIASTGDHASPLELSADIGRVAAIGAWRYTQGVYAIDPTLRAALTETDVRGDLPADVLTRLPEWALYVTTPGMAWLDAELHGFWAHLEQDANTGADELRMLLDTDAAGGAHGLVAIPVHLGPWPVEEAIQRSIDVARANAGGIIPLDEPDAAARIADTITPLLSILLYLCSDAPEIAADRQPGTSPHHPSPHKTKRGWRLFAPDRTTPWTVGRELGATLRRERAEQVASGRTVRSHIRRGHWHGYWRGPRDGDRRFVYHWLPPMLIAPPADDEQ